MGRSIFIRWNILCDSSYWILLWIINAMNVNFLVVKLVFLANYYFPTKKCKDFRLKLLSFYSIHYIICNTYILYLPIKFNICMFVSLCYESLVRCCGHARKRFLPFGFRSRDPYSLHHRFSTPEGINVINSYLPKGVLKVQRIK